MKILITGGAGYIGSILTPMLLNSGNEVTVIDNLMYNQTPLLDYCLHPQLTVVRGDARNTKLLEEQVKKADAIIPLACLTGAPLCDKDPNTARSVNFEAVKTIMDMKSPSQIMVFPNTNSGYGIGGEEICTEESPLNPISEYGVMKCKIEELVVKKKNSVSFRLATVFGMSPRMRMDLLVNDFVYRAFVDQFIVLFESHFKRNYIHIRDIASVFIHAIRNYGSMKGEAYNLGLSDANLSKMELCEKIKEHLPSFHIFESDIAQDLDKRDYIVSNEKIESTGWSPEYSIDYGIKELIKVYSFLKVNSHNNL